MPNSPGQHRRPPPPTRSPPLSRSPVIRGSTPSGSPVHQAPIDTSAIDGNEHLRGSYEAPSEEPSLHTDSVDTGSTNTLEGSTAVSSQSTRIDSTDSVSGPSDLFSLEGAEITPVELESEDSGHFTRSLDSNGNAFDPVSPYYDHHQSDDTYPSYISNSVGNATYSDNTNNHNRSPHSHNDSLQNHSMPTVMSELHGRLAERRLEHGDLPLNDLYTHYNQYSESEPGINEEPEEKANDDDDNTSGSLNPSSIMFWHVASGSDVVETEPEGGEGDIPESESYENLDEEQDAEVENQVESVSPSDEEQEGDPGKSTYTGYDDVAMVTTNYKFLNSHYEFYLPFNTFKITNLYLLEI